MRQAHWLSANKRGELPQTIVVVDTETWSLQIDPVTEQACLWFGWACIMRRSRAGGYLPPEWWRFETPLGFWRQVRAECRDRSKVWIFAHNLSFDFTVLRGWDYTVRDGWAPLRLILGGPPTVIAVRKGTRTLQCVDTLNYARMPLAEIGKAMGCPKLDMPTDRDNRAAWDTYCKNDVEVLRRFLLTYIDFIAANDLGNYQLTLASQAVSAFKHRLNGAAIFLDSNPKALELSREAYHGGRSECFRLGRIQGPLYQLDVNSMYPHVMHGRPYPCVLDGVWDRVSLPDLRRIAMTHMLCARVILDTPDPIYPRRLNDRLSFPVGRFETVLCTPEIREALIRGHIVGIRRVALYRAGEPFTRYVDTLYALRREYKAQDNAPMAWLCKIMLNSLYGKFGQSGRVFERIGDCDPRVVEQWRELDAETGMVYSYRKIGGTIECMSREGEARESHPAIAAHVTAYARMHLWRLIEQAGPSNVWYVDTDSLLVNQEGYDRLSGELSETTLGALKLERTVQSGEIRGLKDYTLDGVTRIKGVRRSALQIDGETFQQPVFVGLKGMIQSGNVNQQIIRQSIKRLTRKYGKGIPMVTGAVRPHALAYP